MIASVKRKVKLAVTVEYVVNNVKVSSKMGNVEPGPSICKTECIEGSEDLESSRKRRKTHDNDSTEGNSGDAETDAEDGEEINGGSAVDIVESEDSSESSEDCENEKWSCDGDFEKFEFEERDGLRYAPDGLDPYDFFKLLFDDSFYSTIVAQINNCGRRRNDEFRTVTMEEFKVFFGLLLYTDTVKFPQLQDYWKSQRLFTSFSRYMSRDRFQEILRCFCFSSDNASLFHRAQTIVDYFNRKMEEMFCPGKELCVNEVVVPWRDELSISRSVKLYTVAESSGITLRMKLRKLSGRKAPTAKTILRLLEEFLRKGHSVYMDKRYSSYKLTKRLLDAKTYCTGLLQSSRKGNDVTVVNAELARDEVVSRHRGNIAMGKFQGTREILFVSSEFQADLTERTRKEKSKKQPLALKKYREFTNGVKKRDEVLSYYTYGTRTFKLWIHIVETLFFNAFLLHAKYSLLETEYFFDFRLSVVDVLLRESRKEDVLPALLQHDHLPETLSRDEKNRIKRKRCRQCFVKGIRKNTNYFCSGCTDNPGLCLGNCFKEYHKDLFLTV